MYACILVVINIFVPMAPFIIQLGVRSFELNYGQLCTMLQWVITVLSLCERRWNNLLMPSLYGSTLVTSSVQPQHYSQSNRLVKWTIQTIKMLLYTIKTVLILTSIPSTSSSCSFGAIEILWCSFSPAKFLMEKPAVKDRYSNSYKSQLAM